MSKISTTSPKQDRSRQTVQRLIDSADSLVSEKGFEEMGIRELCDRAGVTSGAFYARFSKKTDLALALTDRLFDECMVQAEAATSQQKEAGLEASIRSFLERAIDFYRKRGGLIRALIALARTSPDVANRMKSTNEKLFSHYAKLFEQHRSAFAHPKPDLAIRLGLVCILNSLREIVLQQQLVKEEYPFKDSELVSELTCMLMNYLKADR